MTSRADTLPSSPRRRSRSRAIAAVVGPLLLFAAWVVAAPYYSTHLLWGVRAALFWLVPLAVVVVGAVAAVRHLGRHRKARHRRRVLTAGYVTAGVLGVLAYGWWAFDLHSYLQGHDYARHIVVTADPVPRLTERAPYQVAGAQARPSLGDNPGNLVDTTYLPATDTYTGLVAKRGAIVGYDAVLHQDVPLQGRATGSTCKFDAVADRRIGGWFGSNLGRLINEHDRGVSWSDEDVYGYCVEDPLHRGDLGKATPMVVVPLTEQDGWLAVVERPAGVALYNGGTNTLEIRRDAAGIPGPVYPLSLAARQREASAAMGSYADWWFNRVGWETSEGDDDTNSGNTAEYALADANAGRALYVTMLTGRGSATSISAISTVHANAPVDGSYAPVVVHKLPAAWVSPSAIVSRIKADYQDIPNWNTITVMEVAPLSGERWVATLGNTQNVLYRAQGTGTLTGPAAEDPAAADPGRQPTCLYRPDGTTYRCGTLAAVAGNGIGTQYGATPGTVPGATVPGTLTGLSDAQLADLRRQALDLQQRVGQEYDRRLTHPMDR